MTPHHLYISAITDSVTSIGYRTFESCTGLTTITIGSGVTLIVEEAFYGCDNLHKVVYEGTEEQWNSISIGANNEPLINADITYYGENSYKVVSLFCINMQNLSAKIELYKISEESTMYLAVYNSDGTLKGIAKADATLGDSEVILSVPGDYTQGGYTSKVMLWSKSKLKPLEKSIVSIIQ